MSLQDAFEHVTRADDLEEQAEQHRDAALEEIEKELDDLLAPEDDVEVTGHDGVYVTANVWIEELLEAAGAIEDREDCIVSVRPAEVRISQRIPESVFESEDSPNDLEELIDFVVDRYEDQPGAPISIVKEHSESVGVSRLIVGQEIESLRLKGEIYEPKNGFIRRTRGKHE